MSKVSMLEASKRYKVARPTILKHLKQGKITGEKITKDKKTFWQIDTAELARMYEPRDSVAPESAPEVTTGDTAAAPDLQAEVRVLQAKLDAAETLAKERARHIEDLRGLLSGPSQDTVPRRKWWPWSR